MVGLSVILENCMDLSGEKSPQVINKGTMMISPKNGFSRRKNDISDFALSCGFLEFCSLCNRKLLPGKDIYMYKGDKAFCSEECRCRQIFMDEEDAKGGCTREYNNNNCSLSAATSKPPPSSSSSSPSSSRGGKAQRNRANAFAY